MDFSFQNCGFSTIVYLFFQKTIELCTTTFSGKVVVNNYYVEPGTNSGEPAITTKLNRKTTSAAELYFPDFIAPAKSYENFGCLNPRKG